MAKVVLHIHPYSPPCKALILLAHHFKCADQIEFKVIDLTVGAHLTPEYLAINPYHSVPALQHGDVTLYESPAIAQYLAEHFKWEGDYGLPTDHAGKWAVINVLHKHHNIIRAKTGAVFTPWMATFFSKGAVPFDKEAMLQGLEKSKADWKVLDSVLATNDGFLAGKPSIADVMAFSEMYGLVKDKDGKNLSYSIYDFDEHPHIKKWIETMAPIFVDEELECWKVVKAIVGMSKQMMPIALLE